MSRPARAALLALALCMALPGPAPAQPLPFAVPPPAGVVVAPLLLLALPLIIELSRPDESRVRVFEADEDWEGLARLAERRLRERPGDPRWHELRGLARQRQGRCREAAVDLQPAFEAYAGDPAARPGAAFDTGLRLGLCEMAERDFDGAARTFRRLAELAPQRPEPAYHLGLIDIRRGDLAAASAQLAALRERSPPLAQSLAQAIDAAARLAAPGEPPSVPAAMLPTPQLQLGPLVLALDRERWYAGPGGQRTVRGGQGRVPSARTTDVRLATATAYAAAGDGSLAAAIAWSANPQQAYGTSAWNADDPCAAADALYRHRFNRSFDRPECAALRLLEPGGAAPHPDLAPVLAAAGESGVHWLDRAYELRYAAYGLDRVVEVVVLVPVHRMAGDMAAVQWLHALASQLRPLAAHPARTAAQLPPLAPGP
ncbi:MAG TPA: hypothetical protein VGE20_21185 [Ramlibacter sp.]